MLKETNIALKKAIHKSQHCQRNWELSKSIPESDMNTIIEAATQCPSKQNIAYYRAHFITDRKIIEEIHSWTKGFRMDLTDVNDERSLTNTQVLANLLICFEAYSDPSKAIRNSENYAMHVDRTLDTGYDARKLVERDRNMAVGVAAGYVNVTSALLGYSTGCCACFQPQKVQEILNLQGEPLLLMGVGFSGAGRPRREHHEDSSITFPTLRKQQIPVQIWK